MASKGLRQFLDEEQQRAWLEGESAPPDSSERDESLELRFKYAHRFEKLLRLPQAEEALDILRIYGATCLPLPRRTERWYWSVSCLASSPDKPLTRVNASWMELFTLHADPPPAGLRARFILHLSDFTHDGSDDAESLDEALLDQCVTDPGNISHAFWRRNGILIAKVRGAASTRAFIAHPHAARAIRRFNLTHMNRGRNAYQTSHCYSLADTMVGENTHCSAVD